MKLRSVPFLPRQSQAWGPQNNQDTMTVSAMPGTALRFAAPQASPDQAPAWKIRQHKRQSVPGKHFPTLATHGN